MGRKVWFPAVSGPLSAYSAGYGSWLQTQGYSRSAISDRLWQFDQLSRWLEREGLAVGELSVEECERFAASRRAAGRVTLVAPQSMTLPLEYLRALWADADAGAAACARSGRRNCSLTTAATC